MQDEFSATPREFRNFGFVMAAAFGVVGLVLFWRHGWTLGTAAPALWGVGAAFGLLGLAAPGALKTPYLAWMRLAQALNWVMTRVILVLFFFLVIFPVGFVMRLFGYDPLHLRWKRDPQASYWIPREEDPRGHRHFENPF